MRQVMSGLVFALFLTGAAAGAQDKSTTESKVKADNGTVVTMTGCVMIGGTTNFLLTNISAERKEGGGGPSLGGASYALIEREGLELGSYINQRVQLTGVFVPAATKGDRDDKIEIKDAKKSDVTSATGAKATSKEKVKVNRVTSNQFIVASVTRVSPSCEQ